MNLLSPGMNKRICNIDFETSSNVFTNQKNHDFQLLCLTPKLNNSINQSYWVLGNNFSSKKVLLIFNIDNINTLLSYLINREATK